MIRNLFGISQKEFFTTFYEKNCFWSPNHKVDTSNVLTPKEISHFLSSLDLQTPWVKIVENSVEVPFSTLARTNVTLNGKTIEGLLDNDKVLDKFTKGATIIINSGQRFFPNLNKFCLNLTETFKFKINANIYITPKSSQGFNTHYDAHDVLVLQIFGQKTWETFEPVINLPTKNQSFSKLYGGEGLDNLIPLKNLTLEQGNVLYLPRGFPHCVYTKEGISIHITFGFYPTKWIDLLKVLVTKFDNFNAFRKSVPTWNEAEFNNAIPKMTKLIGKALEQEKLWQTSFKEVGEKLNKSVVPYYKNRFFSFINLEQLTKDTLLTFNQRIFLELKEVGPKVQLVCYDKTINLPSAILPTLDFITRQKQFTIAQLPPNIAVEGQFVLIKELIKSGLVAYS